MEAAVDLLVCPCCAHSWVVIWFVSSTRVEVVFITAAASCLPGSVLWVFTSCFFCVLCRVCFFLCRHIVAVLLPGIVRFAFATLTTSPPLVMGICQRVLEQRYDDNLSDKPQVSLVVDAVLDACLAF